MTCVATLFSVSPSFSLSLTNSVYVTFFLAHSAKLASYKILQQPCNSHASKLRQKVTHKPSAAPTFNANIITLQH